VAERRVFWGQDGKLIDISLLAANGAARCFFKGLFMLAFLNDVVSQKGNGKSISQDSRGK